MLTDLHAVEELWARFDADEGRLRLILLHSPTWDVCVKGARWVQTAILDPNPSLDIKVYVVWFNMEPDDDRSRWDDSLLPDPRVAHFWDEGRLVGRWYAENVGCEVCDAGIAWDAFYLYAPEGQWPNARLIASGAPVIRQGHALLERLHGVE